MLSEPEHPVSRMEFKFLSNSRGVIREFDSGTPPEGATGGIITKNKSRPLVECNATLVHVCIYIYILVSLFCTPRSVSFIPLNVPLSLFSTHFRLPAGCGEENWGWRDEGKKGRRPFSRLILARLTSTGTCSESKLFPSFEFTSRKSEVGSTASLFKND